MPAAEHTAQVSPLELDKMKTIAVLAYPDCQLLDVAGPLQVFATANQLLPAPGYEVVIIAREAGPVITNSGMTLLAQRGVADAGDLDTLLVAGGYGVEAACRDRLLTNWLVARSTEVRRLGSVCTGAFLLAEAGLLRGRRAVTHWKHCQQLSGRFPDIRVEPDALYLCDGGIYSSAGVTAGIDQEVHENLVQLIGVTLHFGKRSIVTLYANAVFELVTDQVESAFQPDVQVHRIDLGLVQPGKLAQIRHDLGDALYRGRVRQIRLFCDVEQALGLSLAAFLGHLGIASQHPELVESSGKDVRVALQRSERCVDFVRYPSDELTEARHLFRLQ
jgi:putative intracellular protease/amidase